jgi:hypothetical protein
MIGEIIFPPFKNTSNITINLDASGYAGKTKNASKKYPTNARDQTHILVEKTTYFIEGESTYENEKNITIAIGNQWDTKYEHLLLFPITVRNYKENIDDTGTKNSYKNAEDGTYIGGYVEVYFASGFLNILQKEDDADKNITEVLDQISINANDILYYKVESYD